MATINHAATFGAELRAARAEKKITQKALAEKVGMTDKRISKIERGLELPSMEEVFKIVSALGKKITIV